MCFVMNINYNNVKLSPTEILLVRSVTGMLSDNMNRFQSYDCEVITFEMSLHLETVGLIPTDEKLLKISISNAAQCLGKLNEVHISNHFRAFKDLIFPEIEFDYDKFILNITLHRRELVQITSSLMFDTITFKSK